jgi:hypothetical protein
LYIAGAVLISLGQVIGIVRLFGAAALGEDDIKHRGAWGLGRIGFGEYDAKDNYPVNYDREK